MDQTSLLGSWVQPVLRDMPSPSHGVHVSIPTALADAKTFLTLPDCPVTSGNSRVWQTIVSSQTGELTAAPNLCHRSLHVPWNRLLPTHTTKAYLHYKPNHPAYNIAATLHCLVLSRMQSNRRFCEAGMSPLQALPGHGSAQQYFKQLGTHEIFCLKLCFFFYVAVGSWTHIVRAVSVGFRKWNWICQW